MLGFLKVLFFREFLRVLKFLLKILDLTYSRICFYNSVLCVSGYFELPDQYQGILSLLPRDTLLNLYFGNKFHFVNEI